MNRHLNIFKPFSHNQSKEVIEDNLSRALVLALSNNSLFFHEFLRTVFSETKQKDMYHNLLSDITIADKYSIDIQVETTDLEQSFSKVFALTMSGAELDMSEFLQEKKRETKRHCTDIFISINDIAIVIEVKRDNTDCRNQLYQQVAAFTENIDKNTVFPLDFNWPKLMELVNRLDGFQSLIHQPDTMLKNFIDLIQSHNANWIPVAPLASIGNTISNKRQIEQRINAVLKNIEKEGVELLNYNDRVGLALSVKWAKEIVIYVREAQGKKLKLIFGIWPGNTKGQGTIVLNQLKDRPNWMPPAFFRVNGQQFKTKWVYELKFSHFNGHVANIHIGDEHLKPGKKLISWNVHWNHTGKYNRDQWSKLENFLDDNIVENYNWRKNVNWEGNFVTTKRTYLTMAIGYQIETEVPYSYLQTIDTKVEDLKPLSDFINSIKDEYSNLFSKG